jgi:hypothetical protein
VNIEVAAIADSITASATLSTITNWKSCAQLNESTYSRKNAHKHSPITQYTTTRVVVNSCDSLDLCFEYAFCENVSPPLFLTSRASIRVCSNIVDQRERERASRCEHGVCVCVCVLV